MTTSKTRNVLLYALAAFFAWALLSSALTACSSPPPVVDGPSAAEIELAIFQCKKSVQDKKKELVRHLPRKIQRVLGENQILRIYPYASQNRPPLKQLNGIIAKFPLEGDSAGLWKTQPDARLRTVSGSIRIAGTRQSVSLIFGQPGQEFSAPVRGLGREISIEEIDEHHVFVSAFNQTDPKDPRSISALLRTYRQQTFKEESETILSDYPVFGDGFSDEICDEATRLQ